jgi:hypothetical protein
MEDVQVLRNALDESLDSLEPAPFCERVTAVVGETPSTPGVLTIRTARAIDDEADIEAAATRGAGVQLCYEGLELTRSVLQNRPWEDLEDGDGYYQDLLVAEVLVSRGFHDLSETGVVTDAVAIVQRFGRTQTDIEDLGRRHGDDPLERDVLELAVNAGADLVMDGLPASVRTHGSEIARDLLDYPLPDPAGLADIDDRLDALAAEARVVRANR